MKVCLVHDDFLQIGGGESLFATIASIWPKAPIYTSVVDWQKLPQSIDRSRIKTSWMQKIPFIKLFYKVLLPLYPLAFESFDFSKFDLVISSTTRFANSIITKPKTKHISYINSTPRFLWDKTIQKHYLSNILLFIAKPILTWLKKWDKVASSRADLYIANSHNIRDKIQKYYRRESEVVYPFANTDYFIPAKIHNWQLKSKKYYLIVTRLVKWKRIEIAIQAAAELSNNLIIIGDGPDRNRLENLAKKVEATVEFTGRVSLESLRDYYQNCIALIVTQEEDFGIAAVETQSCGKPVIAYKKSGIREIIDQKCGILFNNQNKDSLKDAIVRQSQLKWNQQAIRKNALRFSKTAFVNNILKKTENYVKSARS